MLLQAHKGLLGPPRRSRSPGPPGSIGPLEILRSSAPLGPLGPSGPPRPLQKLKETRFILHENMSLDFFSRFRQCMHSIIFVFQPKVWHIKTPMRKRVNEGLTDKLEQKLLLFVQRH